MTTFRISRACLGWLVFSLSGCANASFSNGVFRNSETSYRVGLPGSTWQHTTVADNDVTFHRRGVGVIGATATCNDYEDVPSVALMNHLLFGSEQRVFHEEEVVTVDGRGARHVVVDLELDGVPMTSEVYLVRKDRCIYDLSYVAGRDRFALGRSSFQEFVRGFAVLGQYDD